MKHFSAPQITVCDVRDLSDRTATNLSISKFSGRITIQSFTQSYIGRRSWMNPRSIDQHLVIKKTFSV